VAPGNGYIEGVIVAKIKLTKIAVETAQPQAEDVELRDTVVPGFLCKITPAGRRVFMLQYRTNAGQRRKPALGVFGELTVEQARALAQAWLAEVRQGGDPSAVKNAARKAATMKECCHTFMEDHSRQRNKPSTQRGYWGVINRNIIPILGHMKVQDVKRPDIAWLMKKLAYKPAEANRTFGVLHKMFNMTEVWGLRPDGTNPCRHVPMYPSGKATRLITDDEMARIFRQLELTEAEGLENYVIPLAIRLQFEFAARRSEIIALEWDWIDWENRRVVWPDSKTGGMSKPLSEEAYRLLSTAPHREGCPYVLPSPNDAAKPLTEGEHYGGWSRVLKAAGVPHVGTHGIRHRSATDIANSGIPIKVGMALTAHKTVAMFMRYVHTEDDPVRQAAELVANRRKTVVAGKQPGRVAGEVAVPA
jgi:integrase